MRSHRDGPRAFMQMTTTPSAVTGVAALTLFVASTSACRCSPSDTEASSPVVLHSEGKPSPATWPAFPKTGDDIDTLVAGHTRRPVAAPTERLRSPEQVIDRLRAALRAGEVRAGWPSIVAWLRHVVERTRQERRNLYLLWGTFHDSEGQIAAFRHLVGPMGLGPGLAVAAEPFATDGGWAQIALTTQRGDSRALRSYLATGDNRAWDALVEGQAARNHTAWKYSYLPAIMDLVLSARATGQQLVGCDMPQGLQQRIVIGDEHDEERSLRLRELHCALALRDALLDRASPHQVALLWGQEHVLPQGMPRFLDPDAVVISLLALGHRPSEHTLEARLASRLRLTHPIAFPIDAARGLWAVLLNGPWLAAGLDRARDPLDTPLPRNRRNRALVESAVPGRLHMADAVVDVDRALELELSPGDHAFLFEADARLMAGALTLPQDGIVEIEFDPERWSMRVVTFTRP